MGGIRFQSVEPIRPSSRFRGLAITATLVMLIITCCLLFVKQYVSDHLRERMLAEINQRLIPHGLAAQLDSVRWIEGRGLQLEGLSVFDRQLGRKSTIVFISKAFAASTYRLTDVLTQKPHLDSLTLEGLQVELKQTADGQWNLQPLIQLMRQNGNGTLPNFPIHLRRCGLRIPGGLVTSQPVEITDTHFDLIPQPGKTWDHYAVGHLSSNRVERIEFRIGVDSSRRRWQATFAADDIRVTGDVANLIGAELMPEQASLLQSLRGRLTVGGKIDGTMDFAEMPEFTVNGIANQLQCFDASAPFPINNGRLQFTADNSGFQVTQATADIGYGNVALAFRRNGWTRTCGWHVQGTARHVELNSRLAEWLPEKMQKAWRQYQPAGHLDLEFDVWDREGVVTHKIKSTVMDGSFSYDQFPFRVSRCNGRMSWIGNRLSVDLQAVESQQPIRITGQIDNPGPGWTGAIEVRCDGLIPINEKLFRAFRQRPSLARTLRQFHAHGHFGVHGRIERRDPHVERPQLTYRVNIKQATVRYENFNYPFYNVNGTIRVENDVAQFESITGVNNRGHIVCNGQWHPQSGLQLRFIAQSVLLDEELRQALPAYIQESWTQLRPSGTVDHVKLDWAYDHHSGEIKSKVESEIFKGTATRKSSVAVRPTWFPYEMRQLSGKFHYENNQLTVSDLAAKHGKTWISANAVGQFGLHRWQVRFSDLIAGNIVLDDELLGAVPESLAESLRFLRFKGQLNLQGMLHVSGVDRHSVAASGNSTNQFVSVRDPAADQTFLNWDVQLGLGQADVFVGIPLKNINGIVRLKGNYNQQNLLCTGQLSLDSLMYRDVQITRLVGPVSIDSHRVAIGSLSSPEVLQQTPPSVTAELFGGQLQCDCQAQLTGQRDYFFQAALFDAELADFAVDASLPQQNLAGRAYAGIQLTGNDLGSHAMQGKGYVSLRNAKIYELPIMLALLKVLRIRGPDRTAFDSGDVEFEIQGDQIDFNRIELNGDSVSLIGLGNMNLDLEIDLDFYTVVGRNRLFIPILTQLYRAGSQQVLWVKVDGTLENPQTSREVLPGLNDGLKQLLQEFDAGRNLNEKS